ncbi:MAG: hypothetical protein AAGB13_00930 [Cyanobacteria bacterium P01_F01_bin.33]
MSSDRELLQQELDSIYLDLSNRCCSMDDDEFDDLDRRRQELETQIAQLPEDSVGEVIPALRDELFWDDEE